jgi:hypothetical protein
MEESRRGRQSPLKVERAFDGSRLETQILVRAYELAVPVIRQRMDAEPASNQHDRSVNHSFQSQPVAKGA